MATVKYSGTVRALVNTKEEEIETKNIYSLLREIKKKYGKEVYQICKKSHIIVNGENASFYGGFFMKLSKEDVVQILPVCGGG